ncbi:hypothetical protein JOF56_009984 [Kibdelosporangium banguiense]|uniref:Uncharacterized protein n=1 Tax=Kibdelosporangium banguiense TaxID=1365924 RepID=A0ABS4TYW4_9PSEU|nr:hypothetical protein [Kibdelosporangium banguiense]
MFGLVWFRNRGDLTVLGAGFGISRATAYRYHDEDLHEALERAADQGVAYVILDGKVFLRRPLRREDHQRERPAHRPLVFRQGPPARRQHSSTLGTGRVPAVGL